MLRRWLVAKREAAMDHLIDARDLARTFKGSHLEDRCHFFVEQARRRLRIWDTALDIITLNGRR